MLASAELIAPDRVRPLSPQGLFACVVVLSQLGAWWGQSA